MAELGTKSQPPAHGVVSEWTASEKQSWFAVSNES